MVVEVDGAAAIWHHGLEDVGGCGCWWKVADGELRCVV